MIRFYGRCIWLTVLCTVAMTSHGQEISEKEDLAVFALSHYYWQIPGGALSLVDEQIKKAFIGL